MKVLQFGQGNFLRTFADVYFETLNQEGLDYQVYVATAIPHENLEAFRRQGNRYHVVLRGSQGGQPVEQVLPVTCLQEVIDPFLEPEAFYTLAEDPELKLIVSNTTEAGIQFHSQDSFEGFADITFPAKVTKFLYRRFQAGQPGIYLLPVELIDNNAGELARCVEEYITLWGLPQEFRQWNQRENFYCNTLVDRIVSGYPREEETRRHLENLVGQEDSLLAVGEPKRVRAGLKVTGRGVLREEQDVYQDGKKVGVTTSGTHCPAVGVSCAMAYLDRAARDSKRFVRVNAEEAPETIAAQLEKEFAKWL